MSIADYETAISLLRKAGVEPHVVRRPDEHMLLQLEMCLGVTIPSSYRRMLLDFGLLMARTLSISGLGNAGLDGLSDSSVVFATEEDRKDGLITSSMLHITVAGDGPFYVIDCSQPDDTGECPVLEVSPGGADQGTDLVAPSFGTFLLDQVRHMLGVEHFEPESGSKEARNRFAQEYWKKRAEDFGRS